MDKAILSMCLTSKRHWYCTILYNVRNSTSKTMRGWKKRKEKDESWVKTWQFWYKLIILPHKYLNLKPFFLFWRRDSNWPVAQTPETAVPQPSFGLSTIEAVRPFVVPYTPVGSIFSAFYRVIDLKKSKFRKKLGKKCSKQWSYFQKK